MSVETKAESFLEQTRGTAELAQQTLAEAQSLKADEAKVVAQLSESQRIVVESKVFSLANTLTSDSVGVLFHKDHRKGSASFNGRSLEALKSSVQVAATLASLSVEDSFLNLPAPRGTPKKLDFLFDGDVAKVSLEELRDAMAETLGLLTKDSRIALDRFEASVDLSFETLLNTRGVHVAEVQSKIGWSFFGMAVDGDEVTGFDYDGGFSYKREGFRAKMIDEAQIFAEKLLAQLKPEKSPTYKGPVLFTPRAVEEILMGFLAFHAAGSSVMDRKSKWVEKIGETVVSPLITLYDRPWEEKLAGATSYDRDGLATENRTFIDKGVLNLHYHDAYSAKRLEKQPQGTAGGPFGLVMAAGSQSWKDLIGALPRCLVVDRFSGNSDPIRGDFSGVAKASRLFRNGQDAGSVVETMIAGNLFQVLQDIAGISKETLNVSGSMILPFILCDGISVTGA